MFERIIFVAYQYQKFIIYVYTEESIQLSTEIRTVYTYPNA